MLHKGLIVKVSTFIKKLTFIKVVLGGGANATPISGVLIGKQGDAPVP